MTGLQEASHDLTHHGKGEDDEPEHEPGKHHHPPLAEDHELGAACDHRAEFRGRRTDARADEAQPGGEQNRETNRHRHLDQHIGPRVRQQMPKTDAEIGIADRSRRLGKRSVPQRKHLGAHEAQEHGEIHECDGEQHIHRPGTTNGDQSHCEDEDRERLQNIEEAQPDFRRPVQPAPGTALEIPGKHAEAGADGNGQCRCDKRYSDIRARRGKQAREDVDAILIGAEQMFRAWWRQPLVGSAITVDNGASTGPKTARNRMIRNAPKITRWNMLNPLQT